MFLAGYHDNELFESATNKTSFISKNSLNSFASPQASSRNYGSINSSASHQENVYNRLPDQNIARLTFEEKDRYFDTSIRSHTYGYSVGILASVNYEIEDLDSDDLDL
jgi:hypothetical protein